MHVDFVHKLREERRFESFEALKRQILLDAAAAQEHFRGYGVARSAGGT